MTSAYPAPVEALIPPALRLVAELGEVPSRNKLMTEFRIGARKAAQLRDALTLAAADSGPSPRLHAVPTAIADAVPAATDPITPDAAPVDLPGEHTTQASPVDTSSLARLDVSSTDRADRSGIETSDQGTVAPASLTPATETSTQVTEPVSPPASGRWRLPTSWPLVLLALPAFVAIWSGWVGLAELAGFGLFHPLPGIADGFQLNTAITLPIGVETYAAYALRVALAAGTVSSQARRFAGWSAGASLALGALGQVAYHLMSAAHMRTAPWPITTAVACLPVAVLGFAAALDHLKRHPTIPAADIASAGPEVSQ